MDWRAVWSPDGERLAFISERDGDREVYVMRADGSEQERLTSDPGCDCGVDW
jgi:TolB protein